MCVCVCVCVVYRGTWLCIYDSTHELIFQVISSRSPTIHIAKKLLHVSSTISPYPRISGTCSFYMYGRVTKARGFSRTRSWEDPGPIRRPRSAYAAIRDSVLRPEKWMWKDRTYLVVRTWEAYFLLIVNRRLLCLLYCEVVKTRLAYWNLISKYPDSPDNWQDFN